MWRELIIIWGTWFSPVIDLWWAGHEIDLTWGQQYEKSEHRPLNTYDIQRSMVFRGIQRSMIWDIRFLSPVLVFHTASFTVFGSKLCLWRDVKLCKNATWHDLESKVISHKPKVIQTWNFLTIWGKIINAAIQKQTAPSQTVWGRAKKSHLWDGGCPPRCGRWWTREICEPFIDIYAFVSRFPVNI